MTAPVRVAVVARSVFPLHGHGGLERHVYDLVRHLARAGAIVTLITRTPVDESAAEKHDGKRAHRGRSADFQSAVSPSFTRQGVRMNGSG